MSKRSSRKKFRFLGIGTAILAIFVLGFTVLKLSFKSSFCANSVSCISDLSGNYDPNAKTGQFMGEKVSVPSYIAEEPVVKNNVLGTVPPEAKRIEVDLTNQMLYAYQNNQVVMSFPISSGKWHPTPTGTFHIWVKLRYTRMTGGMGADAYDLPNVPWVMFFANDQVGEGEGFSLHGAYWHNNFGHPMSHGCVNISPENAEKLYEWADPPTEGNTTYATAANPGTEVVIYGTAPGVVGQ
ncbi:MAG: L,D-transpeptidase [Candidatus Microgenomates bacterium]